jgi:putative adhesin
MNLSRIANTHAVRNAVLNTTVVLGITLGVGATAVAQEITGSFERNLDVGDSVELDVATGSGAITVRNGNAGEVTIRGRIVAREEWFRQGDDVEELVRQIEAEPPIELNGTNLRVGYRDESDGKGHVSISYEIEVPTDTRVRSRSGSGSQTLSGVAGPVEARSGSGTLRLTNISGDVEASAGSGSIRGDGIAGAFTAETGSGSVTLEQSAPGDVVISTGSGSSHVSGVEGALRVRSGSGSVSVEGEQRGPWDLQAGSGSIEIRLPSSAAFELDAQAGSGVVDTDHPVAVQGQVQRNRLSGEVRGGGPLLRVRTGSGGIRIE